MLTQADALALWNFFSRAQGRYRSFTFTDPDSGTTYTCRFAQDSLEWRFVDAGVNAVQVTIQELA